MRRDTQRVLSYKGEYDADAGKPIDRAVNPSTDLNDSSIQPVRLMSPVVETINGPVDQTQDMGFGLSSPADPLGFFSKAKPVRNDSKEGR